MFNEDILLFATFIGFVLTFIYYLLAILAPQRPNKQKIDKDPSHQSSTAAQHKQEIANNQYKSSPVASDGHNQSTSSEKMLASKNVCEIKSTKSMKIRRDLKIDVDFQQQFKAVHQNRVVVENESETKLVREQQRSGEIFQRVSDDFILIEQDELSEEMRQSDCQMTAYLQQNDGNQKWKLGERSEDNKKYCSAVIEAKVKARQHARKEQKRLQIEELKLHYKSTISHLEQKVRTLAQKHNESISVREQESFDLSIVSSATEISEREDQVMITFGEIGHAKEADVNQSETQIIKIKEELIIHQDLVTNLLEEQFKLKEQIKQLQQQKIEALKESEKIWEEKLLLQKQSMIKSQLKPAMVEETTHFQELSSRSNILTPKGGNGNSKKSFYSSSTDNLHLNNKLYQSQFVFDAEKYFMQVGSKSQINVKTIIEAIISPGLLGQCRFINQISKHFISMEIKKWMKQPIQESHLVYRHDPHHLQNMHYYLDDIPNLLLLLQLENTKNIAVYMPQPITKNQIDQTPIDQQHYQGHLFLDIANKKVIKPKQNTAFIYREDAIAFGLNELTIKIMEPDWLCIESSSMYLETWKQLLETKERVKIRQYQFYELII